MTCVICKHGQTRPQQVSLTLERPPTTLVIRSVPAQVCENCGEQYVDEQTTLELLRQAEAAAQAGVELEIRPYAAA